MLKQFWNCNFMCGYQEFFRNFHTFLVFSSLIFYIRYEGECRSANKFLLKHAYSTSPSFDTIQRWELLFYSNLTDHCVVLFLVFFIIIKIYNFNRTPGVLDWQILSLNLFTPIWKIPLQTIHIYSIILAIVGLFWTNINKMRSYDKLDFNNGLSER